MKFYYEAFTTRGEPKMGEIEAQSEEHAAGKIRNELGLIAREIRPQPFDGKLTHNRAVATSEAKPFDPENVQVETPSLRMNPTPEAPKAPAPAPAPDPREEFAAFKLSSELTRLSDVARKMELWYKAHKDGSAVKEGPSMGGVSWEIWEQSKKEIIRAGIQKAILRAAGLD